MRNYEALFILNLAGREDGLKETIDRLSAEVTKLGAKIETVQKMEKRAFARVADKKVKEGFYVNFIFAAEPEVADNLRWLASPDGSARFNVEYRQDRTREVTFSRPGTFVLRATSVVYCGDDVAARPIAIKVVARPG